MSIFKCRENGIFSVNAKVWEAGGLEGGKGVREESLLQIPCPCLHYVCIYTTLLSSFHFWSNPCDAFLQDPWTMAYSKNSKRKFFFNKMTKQATYDLPSESIAPFQWVLAVAIARAEAVERCSCIWMFGREFRCALLFFCSCLHCKHSSATSRVCCINWYLTDLGNCWSGVVALAVDCYE